MNTLAHDFLHRKLFTIRSLRKSLLILSFLFYSFHSNAQSPVFPIADAGSNQTTNEGQVTLLNGLGSSVDEQFTISYQWSQLTGTPVILNGADTAIPTFIAPQVGLGGEVLQFQLIVSDGINFSAPSTVFVNVSNVNLAPIADAGPNQTVNMQTLVTLDGSSSFDPDGDSVNFVWTQMSGPLVTLNLADPVRPTFLAPTVASEGAIITFSLVVSDGSLNSESSIVNINIKNTNNAPIANAGTAQTVSSEALVTLDGSNSYDPDGETLSYSWVQTAGPTVTLQNSNTVQPTFTSPNVSVSSNLTFTLTVSDGTASSSASVVVTVQKINLAPIAIVGPEQTVLAGTTAILDGSQSYDPDGDQLTYVWTQTAGPVASIDLTDQLHPILQIPQVTQLTTLTFSLKIFDGQLWSQTVTVNINVQALVSPPSCHLARPSESVLWPPDHRMTEIKVKNVFDDSFNSINSENNILYTGIFQDEPTNGTGDGNTPIDGIIDAKSVLLRRERKAKGTGRVYTINFTATNSNGSSCNGSVKVCVPLNASNKTCTEESTSYDSTH